MRWHLSKHSLSNQIWNFGGDEKSNEKRDQKRKKIVKQKTMKRSYSWCNTIVFIWSQHDGGNVEQRQRLKFPPKLMMPNLNYSGRNPKFGNTPFE